MDVIIFFNGLGNQMSQYAFYLQKKALDEKTEYLIFCNEHNGLELNKIFKTDLENTFKRRLLLIPFRILLTSKLGILKPFKTLIEKIGYKIIKESFNYKFNSKYLESTNGTTFYFGGWPSEKYFIEVREKVLKAFMFKKPEDPDNVDFIKRIESENSVALHVRRGDYLIGDNLNIFGGVCTVEYFKKAIANIEAKLINPHFFVFSNDMEWVKENLQLPNVSYVICNNGINSWKDMYLMSKCKHNIISNSTFSWWGAWLNTNPSKIVISPTRYLNNDIETDFYPESWTKISQY